MSAETYVAILARIASNQVVERAAKFFKEISAEKRREIAERRKTILDATVALVTATQNTGKDYYAGDVSRLFTRLAYLMEHDGAAWDKAEFDAEAHGKHFDGLPPEDAPK